MTLGVIIYEMVYDDGGNPADYIILDVNQACERLLGIKRENALGRPATKVYGLKRAPHLERFHEMISKGKPFDSEECFPKIKKYFACSSIPLGGDRFTVIFKDMTERKRMEEEIKEQKERYRFLTENVVEILWTTDMDLRVTYVSPSIEKVLGFTPEERKNQTVDETMTPESLRILIELIQEEIERERTGEVDPDRSVQIEVEYYHKDGRIVPMEIRAKALRDEKGNIIGFYGSSLDITEKRRAEKRVMDSDRRFYQFFENAPDYCYIVSAEGRILEINKSALKALDYGKGEIIGKDMIDTIYSEQSKKRVRGLISNLEEAGRIRNEELTIVTKGNETRTILLNADVVKDEEGGILYSISIQRDITRFKEMEEEIKRGEEKYRLLTESIAEVIWTTDMELNVTYISPTVKHVLGYTPEERKRLGLKDVAAPASLKRLTKLLSEEIERERTGEVDPDRSVQIEVEYYHKDGHTVWVEEKIKALRNEKGTIVGFIGSSHDITEKRKAEERLKESEERYRAIVENSHDGILLVDDSRRLLYTNETLCELLGYTRKELVGKDFIDLLDSDSREIVLDRYKRRQRGEDVPTRYEFSILTKNGEKRTVEVSSAVITDTKGRKMTVAQLLDVTERKLAEKALKLSRERLDLAMSVTNEGIWDWDLTTDTVFYDPRYYTMAGYEVDAFPNTLEEFRKRVHPDDIDRVMDTAWEYIRGERERYRVEFRFRRPDGSWMWILGRGRIVSRDEKGKPTRFVGTHVNITERKEMEIKIKESEERYRALFDQASDAIFMIDGAIFIDCNRATISMFGLERMEDIIGHHPWEFSPERQPDGRDSKKKAKEYIESALNGDPQRFYWKHSRKDGTEFDTDVSLSRVLVAGKSYVHAIVRDITKQRRASERIRILSSVVEQSLEGIAIADLDGNILFTNPAWVRMHGYDSEEELMGMHLSIFHTEDQFRKEVEPFNMKVLRNGFNMAEVGHRRVDGTTFPTLMTTTLLRNENGEPIGFAGIATDITSSKKAEETIREERNRAEFYLDLMNHDITNIHQGIYSWVQLMQLKKGSKINIDTDLTPLEDLVKRSINLVKNVQLLTGLGSKEPELRKVDLRTKLEDSLNSIRSIFHQRKIDIDLRYPEESVFIMAEPLISELFINLLHNSVKFQGNEAIIEVELSANPDEGSAVIRIADHGPGIPDDIKPYIFDRFRKKEQRFHSGIGLSLVKELVERYNGTIEVMDRVKKHSSRGTCFIVKFPLADG